MEKPINDTEEDSEELKREKEHNKKYGVEIKQTFPFPEFDSGFVSSNERVNKMVSVFWTDTRQTLKDI